MDIRPQKSWNILLIGDVCEDIYHYGICERMSPEAPVPVFKEFSVEVRPGMSSNVKENLKNFGMNINHIFNENGIKKHRFIETRYMQQLFRCDEGECAPDVYPIPPLDFGDIDAVVISDYDKGFVTPSFVEKVIEKFGDDIPIFVDSKKKDLTIFNKCIIKINNIEESKAKLSKGQDVIVTLGASGARWNSKIFKADKVDVYDVCGAGDVFLSGLVYGWLRYGNIPEAIKLANKCASLSVTKSGTYILSLSDIIGIIRETSEEKDGICI